MSTCAICGGDCFGTRYGLCSNCLKEWTVTGTNPLPDWLRTFSREHHNLERHKHNGEIPFSLLEPVQVEPSYVEIRYQIIEERFHKTNRRGRPRKLYGKENSPAEGAGE